MIASSESREVQTLEEISPVQVDHEQSDNKSWSNNNYDL